MLKYSLQYAEMAFFEFIRVLFCYADKYADLCAKNGILSCLHKRVGG